MTRGPIGVNFVDGPQDLTLASYDRRTDSITVHEGRATGSYGLFVAAHEYGHAVHNAQLNGIILTIANASDPTCLNHDYTRLTNYQCAYVEGIADYHAVAAWGATLGDTLYTEFNNGVFAGLPVGQSSPPVGPSTEGAIGSMLLHMGDGTAQRVVYHSGSGYIYYSDNVAFGHATIASAIRDCTIFHGSVGMFADGIDYLSYCLEQPMTIEPGPGNCSSMTSASSTLRQQSNSCVPGPSPGVYLWTIFPDELQRFSGLRPSTDMPTEWRWGNRAPQREGWDPDVRTVWMCNLFFCS